MNARLVRQLGAGAAVIVMGMAGCAAPASRGDSAATDSAAKAPAPAADTRQADSARLVQLEDEARALIKTTGCATAEQCRTAPVGQRGCGGPREYVVYCPLTTDSTALAAKLAALDSAERAFNTKYQVISTCEMRMPPGVALAGGSCQAKP